MPSAPRRRALPLDAYVVETLMADLVGHDRSPAAFLVYLWLCGERARRRPRAPDVVVSLREIAEGTGLAKRTVQSALARLARRRLVAVARASPTAVPRYRPLAPWRR